MQLEWLRCDRVTDDGKWTRYYLVDQVTSRVFGSVEHPGVNEAIFESWPFSNLERRYYTEEDAARSYLEACALEMQATEIKGELGLKITAPDEDESLPGPTTAVESKQKTQ